MKAGELQSPAARISHSGAPGRHDQLCSRHCASRAEPYLRAVGQARDLSLDHASCTRQTPPHLQKHIAQVGNHIGMHSGPSSHNTSRSFPSALAAVTPGKSAPPAGVAPSHGPSLCTGQVFFDSLHQQVLTSWVLWGRFFLLANVSTTLSPSLRSTDWPSGTSGEALLIGSASEGSLRRKAYAAR